MANRKQCVSLSRGEMTSWVQGTLDARGIDAFDYKIKGLDRGARWFDLFVVIFQHGSKSGIRIHLTLRRDVPHVLYPVCL